MAKRREPRRKRSDGAVASDNLSEKPGEGAQTETDGSSAAMQSFAEYLSFRNAIIGLAVIQILVVVILGPLHYQHSLETGITQGLEERDYQRAYSSLRRMDFWFGRNPDNFQPQEFIPSLIPNQRRLPSVTLRYILDGAWCLVEMDRLEEAAALLDRISPQAEAMSYYQRQRWKVPYLRGRILLAQDDPDGALGQFAQALALNRAHPDLNFHAGSTLAAKGASLEAAFYLSQAARHPAFEEAARALLQDIRTHITL